MNPLKDPTAVFDIAGKTALVTGASGAFGRVAALALAGAGARTVLSGANAAALEAVAKEVRLLGGETETIGCRPNSVDEAEAMVAVATEEFGGLHIAVVASGMNDPAPIEDMSLERWQAVMDANVRGSWLVCRAAGQRMIAQGRGGKVILLSSTRGKLGHPTGYSAYCPSKSAVDGIVRALACEWGRHGINVNAIGPTVFRSSLTAWMFVDDPRGTAAREGILARIPLGRLGEPEDLVGVLLFLSSAASDFCTGQILYVDGGYTAG